MLFTNFSYNIKRYIIGSLYTYCVTYKPSLHYNILKDEKDFLCNNL